MFSRWWSFPLALLLSAVAAGVLVIVFIVVIVWPTLPDIDVLTNYQPKVPLRVYSSEGLLIGEFGEERRAVVKIAAVPKEMREAILAAEDERFYQHGGVDYVGVIRAALSNFVSGGARQGASTITMQVARNFFLSKEKTFTRKFNEMLLAFKIEHGLAKDQILELYINQIYLGQRAYGFAAAAQIYFGKSLDQLNVAEMAMLAGLPKAPSSFNPVVNPKRAKLRQQYVLRRMRELDFISDEQWQAADKQVLTVKKYVNEFAVKADHFAEMVRQVLYERFQDDIYTRGFKVYTTLSATHQNAAYAAVRAGVIDYDHRHGYRGAESYVELGPQPTDEDFEDALQDETESDDIYPALVLDANVRAVKIYRKGGETLEISGEGLKFAQKMLGDKSPANQRVRRGAVIRIQKDEKGHWQITQLPQVEAALVSTDPADGAIRALVGSFDFARNKYNHVTQALRQAGSSFKPFVYSAALEKGFTPATIINDAPLVFDASQTGSEPWEPKNFDGKFEGPMRMRTALVKSKNLVSVRILQAITPQYAQDYITRFGFEAKYHPPYLTMALGAGNVTPMQMVGAYGVFANGGYRVPPYFIARVEDMKGNIVAQARPERAGESAERAIDARNAFIMTNMLQDVVKMGTATRAMQLGRTDLAGKTGTTNEFVDAWFCGFGSGLVAVAWIGFDNPHTLGHNETGGQAALPMWISYMGKVMKGVEEQPRVVPEAVVQARINPESGLRDPDGRIAEYFYQEFLPAERDGEASAPAAAPGAVKPPEEVKSQLF
ncbi:MAG: penicillin-binding protein 1A [Betaproteobacteria bacterium]|nr:penicillin-binding protein 1A [Betaproteobacteria bacterium]